MVLAGTAAGCTFSTGTSPQDAAVELIEGELGDQVGMVFSSPSCTAPPDTEVGTTFTCTARNEAGDTVTFDGVIDPDDSIFVAPSNVILAEEMDLVEAEAAQVLGDDIGVAIDPSAVECPEETTVLEDDQLRCEITDVDTGDRYEMIATVSGFVPREGFASRAYVVGELLN